MTNVAIFLDVGVISRMCGYFLAEEMQATSDFVNICRRTGCEIKVFSHTIAEFKKVCTTGLLQIGRPESHGPMGPYCFSTGRLPADVIEEIVNIESFFIDNDIETIETPSFGEGTNAIEIDTASLMMMIANEFSGETRYRSMHRGDEADYNDYLSLRGIFILREGKAARSLESCGALFLTNTFKLQKVSNRFFKQFFSAQGEVNEAQLCFTESGIAPRIWLKVPTEFSKIARGQIIKAALSNLNPSSSMRDGFLAYVNQQVNERAIYASEALDLKYSRYVDYALAIDGAFDGGANAQQQYPQIVVDALRESRARVIMAEKRGRVAAVTQAKAELERLEALGVAETAGLTSGFNRELDGLREEIKSADRKLNYERLRFALRERRLRSLLKGIAYLVLPGAIFWSELLPVIVGEEKFHASTAVFVMIVLLAVVAVRFGLESEGGRVRLARKLLGGGAADDAETDWK